MKINFFFFFSFINAAIVQVFYYYVFIYICKLFRFKIVADLFHVRQEAK